MSAWSAQDHAHMARALRLAERGLFTTSPNPRVGCVLAHGDEVVGEGWHVRAGEAHSEVFALSAAGARARGATAYVTLEPCAHFGRTPPCADALISAGVARVVIAHEDPFAQVDGRGAARLTAAGIAVEKGLMREAAFELNRGFFTRVTQQRPWVRVKLAMSVDGKTALANGRSNWITGAAARTDVQRWRARSDAILTGSGTVRADDPQLTVRATDLGEVRAPLRVVLDVGLATAKDRRVLDGSVPTLFLHAPNVRHPAHFDRVECVPVAMNEGRLDLHAVLRHLGERGINEVQVEAGHTVCGELFAHGLVDELLLYMAPVVLGDAALPLLSLPTLTEMSQRHALRVIDRRAVGDDWRMQWRRA